MKTYSIFKYKKASFILMSLFLVLGCQTDDSNLQTVKSSTNPNVFIDGFSSGLQFAAFGGTDIFAFQVDDKVTYNNSSASMRFDVPNANDPAGSYAGGAFFTESGRDLTSYNALTFWAKSSQAATVGVLGFGIDLGENKFQASTSGLKLSTVWRKYIIPIPDPSKLKMEKGLFYFSAGPENGNGYSFWVDDVKFENLGTLAHGQASIFNGKNIAQTSYVGVALSVSGIISTFNYPTAINQSVSISPNYLVFSSSNTAVATVDSYGKIAVVGSGTAVITATFAGEKCTGSLTVSSPGSYINAPTPTLAKERVISVFSDTYSNVPVAYYNGYWQPWQTTKSEDFVVNGDNVLNYTIFNFVGIEFSRPTINATQMTKFHMDVFIPAATVNFAELRVILVDFGPDGAQGGGDDTRHSTTINNLSPQKWIAIDLSFANLTGLLSRKQLGQIILEGGNSSNIFVDNIYFYN